MKNIKYILGIIACCLCCNILNAQLLILEKTYGNDNWNASGIDSIQTYDGGY
ncbi:MAG: hypothetical protein SGJ10_00925 [Bacteroidota bacterium]|nr:hypothetical protein [Bacteroidota bacterium]